MNLELVVTFPNQALVNLIHLRLQRQLDLYLTNQELKHLVMQELVQHLLNI